jgi:hypothetical protein
MCPTDNPTHNSSACALPIVDRLQGQSPWRAESLNIPLGRLVEEAIVFATELTGAFVSPFKGRTGGVHTVHEHAFPRRMQPELFRSFGQVLSQERLGGLHHRYNRAA